MFPELGVSYTIIQKGSGAGSSEVIMELRPGQLSAFRGLLFNSQYGRLSYRKLRNVGYAP